MYQQHFSLLNLSTRLMVLMNPLSTGSFYCRSQLVPSHYSATSLHHCKCLYLCFHSIDNKDVGKATVGLLSKALLTPCAPEVLYCSWPCTLTPTCKQVGTCEKKPLYLILPPFAMLLFYTLHVLTHGILLSALFISPFPSLYLVGLFL